MNFQKVKAKSKSFRAVVGLTAAVFIATTVLPFSVSRAAAQGLELYPPPGQRAETSGNFQPALLRGVKIDPDNPFNFDFIVDLGETGLRGAPLVDEGKKLIRYFMAALTTPEDDLWVNLSPYEGDKIIPEAFGLTELGRDLLAQDYLLKQLSASMTFPEEELGKKFWDKIFSMVYEKLGTSDIPVNTFNKIWIVPGEVSVFVTDDTAYVVKADLKVMMEEDYLAFKKNRNNERLGLADMKDTDAEELGSLSSGMIKDMIVPIIEKEVNEGKNFAPLRQVYHSLILAMWYKEALQETLLTKIYVDKNKVKGVDIDDPDSKYKIFEQYVEAYKDGAFSLIREEYDPRVKKVLPRKYFSGGMDMRQLRGSLRAPRSSLGSIRAEMDTGIGTSRGGGRGTFLGAASPIKEPETPLVNLSVRLTEPDLAASPVAEDQAKRVNQMATNLAATSSIQVSEVVRSAVEMMINKADLSAQNVLGGLMTHFLQERQGRADSIREAIDSYRRTYVSGGIPYTQKDIGTPFPDFWEFFNALGLTEPSNKVDQEKILQTVETFLDFPNSNPVSQDDYRRAIVTQSRASSGIQETGITWSDPRIQEVTKDLNNGEWNKFKRVQRKDGENIVTRDGSLLLRHQSGVDIVERKILEGNLAMIGAIDTMIKERSEAVTPIFWAGVDRSRYYQVLRVEEEIKPAASSAIQEIKVDPQVLNEFLEHLKRQKRLGNLPLREISGAEKNQLVERKPNNWGILSDRPDVRINDYRPVIAGDISGMLWSEDAYFMPGTEALTVDTIYVKPRRRADNYRWQLAFGGVLNGLEKNSFAESPVLRKVYEAVHSKTRLNLPQGTDLSKFNLPFIYLPNADLQAIRLPRLYGAIIDGANLDDAIAEEGVDLSFSSAESASFQRANLDRARLQDIYAPHANFTDAKMRKVDGGGAVLSGAILVNTQVSGSKFPGGLFDYADLSGAQADSAEFPFTNFSGATLKGMQADRANFLKAYLPGADLSNGNFEQTRFVGATLDSIIIDGAMTTMMKGVILRNSLVRGAEIENADMRGAELLGAFFWGTKFKGPVNLSGSYAPESDFYGSFFEANEKGAPDLQGVNLQKADLRGTTAKKTNFGGANFTGAQMTGSEIKYSNLRNADLSGIRASKLETKRRDNKPQSELEAFHEIIRQKIRMELINRGITDEQILREAIEQMMKSLNLKLVERKTSFRGSNMSGATMKKADFRGVDLRETDLRAIDGNKAFGVILTGADARGADLTGSDLTNAILDGIVFDESTKIGNTIFPVGFDIQAAIARGERLNAAGRGSSPIEDADRPSFDRARFEDLLAFQSEQMTSTPGGIDFTPDMLDLKIGGESISSPVNLDPALIEQMNIDGLVPFIYNITPVTDLPLLLGVTPPEKDMELGAKK